MLSVLEIWALYACELYAYRKTCMGDENPRKILSEYSKSLLLHLLNTKVKCFTKFKPKRKLNSVLLLGKRNHELFGNLFIANAFSTKKKSIVSVI